MEPLKEMFNLHYYEKLRKAVSAVHSDFADRQFFQEVTHDLATRELNGRLRHTTVVLKRFLPDDYEKALEVLWQTASLMPTGYTALVFPDFVGQFGHGHFDRSMEALAYFTSFGSSEFAIRTFLKADFDRTIKVMYNWAESSNHHVRRLASEGARPRLPWSFKLQRVIDEPQVTQPILEQLRADNELYVRKSVANHLNDFSKDNPEFMLNLVSQWDTSNAHTAWIVKHGTRTLIKKGHPDSMAVFGFEKEPRLSLKHLKVQKDRLQLGETLVFSFDLVSEKDTVQKLVVDYIIHYCKGSGERSPKVFKLKELNLLPEQTVQLSKTQVFRDFSTRKHYPGVHLIEIQVNGKVMGEVTFDLQTTHNE